MLSWRGGGGAAAGDVPPPPPGPPPDTPPDKRRRIRPDSTSDPSLSEPKPKYPIDSEVNLLQYTKQLNKGKIIFPDHANFKHIIDLLQFGIEHSSVNPAITDHEQTEMDTMFKSYYYLVADRKEVGSTPCVKWIFKNTYSFEITLPTKDLKDILSGILDPEDAEKLTKSEGRLLISDAAGGRYHFAENVGTSKGDASRCCIIFSSWNYRWLRDYIMCKLKLRSFGKGLTIKEHEGFLLGMVSNINKETCKVDDFLYTASKTDKLRTYVLTVLQKYVETQHRTGSGIMFKAMMRDLQTKQTQTDIIKILNAGRQDTIEFESKYIRISYDIWKDRGSIFTSSTALSEYSDKLRCLIVSEYAKYDHGGNFGSFLKDVATKLYICNSVPTLPGESSEHKYNAVRLWKVLKRCIRNLAFNLTKDSLLEMLKRIHAKGFYGQFNVGTFHHRTPFEEVVTIAASFTDMTLL